MYRLVSRQTWKMSLGNMVSAHEMPISPFPSEPRSVDVEINAVQENGDTLPSYERAVGDRVAGLYAAEAARYPPPAWSGPGLRGPRLKDGLPITPTTATASREMEAMLELKRETIRALAHGRVSGKLGQVRS